MWTRCFHLQLRLSSNPAIQPKLECPCAIHPKLECPCAVHPLCSMWSSYRAVCHGCQNRYPKKLTPPLDLCIQTEEWWQYTPAGALVPQVRWSNTYYHCRLSCVKLKWPGFTPSQLVVDEFVASRLGEVHKQHLFDQFHLTLEWFHCSVWLSMFAQFLTCIWVIFSNIFYCTYVWQFSNICGCFVGFRTE